MRRPTGRDRARTTVTAPNSPPVGVSEASASQPTTGARSTSRRPGASVAPPCRATAARRTRSAVPTGREPAARRRRGSTPRSRRRRAGRRCRRTAARGGRRQPASARTPGDHDLARMPPSTTVEHRETGVERDRARRASPGRGWPRSRLPRHEDQVARERVATGVSSGHTARRGTSQPRQESPTSRWRGPPLRRRRHERSLCFVARTPRPQHPCSRRGHIPTGSFDEAWRHAGRSTAGSPGSRRRSSTRTRRRPRARRRDRKPSRPVDRSPGHDGPAGHRGRSLHSGAASGAATPPLASDATGPPLAWPTSSRARGPQPRRPREVSPGDRRRVRRRQA